VEVQKDVNKSEATIKIGKLGFYFLTSISSNTLWVCLRNHHENMIKTMKTQLFDLAAQEQGRVPPARIFTNQETVVKNKHTEKNQSLSSYRRQSTRTKTRILKADRPIDPSIFNLIPMQPL
jgi:hypothetical protein